MSSLIVAKFFANLDNRMVDLKTDDLLELVALEKCVGFFVLYEV